MKSSRKNFIHKLSCWYTDARTFWYNSDMVTAHAAYQTRTSGNEEALSAYAELFGVLRRRLFADVSAGRSSASLKSDYIRRYGMPARVFNAVRASLEGRMSAASESQKLHHQTLEGLIDRTEKQAAYSACIRRHSESGHVRAAPVHPDRRQPAQI